MGRGISHFKNQELPTILEVLRYVFFVKNTLKPKPNSVFLAQNTVTDKLILHWQKSNIATISKCRVNALIKKYWKLRDMTTKYGKNRFEAKKTEFRRKFNVRFDISAKSSNTEANTNVVTPDIENNTVKEVQDTFEDDNSSASEDEDNSDVTYKFQNNPLVRK